MKWLGNATSSDTRSEAEIEAAAVFRERVAEYNDVLKYQGEEAAKAFEADTRGIVADLYKKARGK